MKAMIFAAGLGTRLKPWTDEHPKALVPLGGMPMLGRVIEKLKCCGISEMVVNIHHYANQVADYLSENDNFGIDIRLSDESDMLLDTGGGLLKAAHLLGSDDVLVHNADIFTDFDIRGMEVFYRSHQADAALLVADRSTSRYLIFDPGDRRMCGWVNKSTGAVRPQSVAGYEQRGLVTRAFGGVHTVGPEVLKQLAAYNAALVAAGQGADNEGIAKFSITDFYIDYCSRLNISGFEPAGAYRWFDIGKPEKLAEAAAALTWREVL